MASTFSLNPPPPLSMHEQAPSSPFPQVPDVDEWEGTLKEAEGLIDLRLFVEAWACLESLPAHVQLSNLVVRARVPCLLAFGKVEIAIRFAGILQHGDDQDRLVAASAYVAIAVRRYKQRQRRDGWKLLQLAVEARPDLKHQIMHDVRLPKRVLSKNSDSPTHAASWW